MKKFTIGFNADRDREVTPAEPEPQKTTDDTAAPKESVVDVYFPEKNRKLSYYNDKFDLHRGDVVYVEGKLEGVQGRVVGVNYSFKIKPPQYKRVIAVADTAVKGTFFLSSSHLLTFDPNALPYGKALSWFKPPGGGEKEYVTGKSGESFPLDNLRKMDINSDVADRGYNYYVSNNVVYLSVDGTHGRAIVRGTEVYELEFEYSDGEIQDLVCPCFYGGPCKHEFAAMLQLADILTEIEKNYENEYDNYFAAIYQEVFSAFAIGTRDTGKITFM